jgi:hypothetical protein
MTRDDIIRMAQSVGADTYGTMVELGIDELWDFAALVAAAEREACAKELEKISNAPDLQAYAAAIRARGQK